MSRFLCLGLGCAIVASLWTGRALSTEDHLARIYQDGVLAPDLNELEEWIAHRYGRADHYRDLDQQLELEVGLIPSVRASFSWDFAATVPEQVDTTADPAPMRSFDLDSVSCECRIKLSDPLIDAVGTWIYLNGSFGPAEADVEGQLLFDKRLGNWIAAVSLAGGHHWAIEHLGEAEPPLDFALRLSAGYLILPSLVLGVEIQQVGDLERDKGGTAVVYGGPVLAYEADRFWLAAGVTPQLASLSNAPDRGRFDRFSERLQSRILLGLGL